MTHEVLLEKMKRALMPSLSPHVNGLSENAILTFKTCVFDYQSGQMGTANHKNMNMSNGYIERTRRPVGLFVF